MYYGLHKRTSLRPEDGFVTIFRSDRHGEGYRCYHPVLGFMVALLDGTRTLDEAAAMAAQVFRGTSEADLLESLRKAVADGDDMYVASPTPRPDWARSFNPADCIMPARHTLHPRLKTPLILCLIMTNLCSRACAYCCMAITPNRTEADFLPVALARRVIREGAELGVRTLILHGGEPLAHPRFLEILREATEAGMFISVSTKARIGPERAKRLAAAGLEEIQVSIDSADPAIADSLVGTPGYFHQTIASIRNLQAAGVRVTTNTVVTPAGFRTVPALVRQLIDLGVEELSVNGAYESERTGLDFKLPADDWRWLMQELGVLKREYRGRATVVLPGNTVLSYAHIKDCMACDGLKSGLVIGADGQAYFCDRLVHMPELAVGDARQSTLAEIWNGQGLMPYLNPTPEQFPADSPCRGCKYFSFCNQRGRCAHKTLVTRGVVFGPDNCPFNEIYKEAAGANS